MSTGVPIEVIDPTTGNVICLKVTEKNPEVRKMYISQLELYAECLDETVVTEVNEGIVSFAFQKEEVAHLLFGKWKNKRQ